MKKWLPYVVAAVLGLGVAILAFGPGTGRVEAPAKPDEKVATRSVTRTGADREPIAPGARLERDDLTSAEVVADAVANPPPPPGTLRPQNPAEIAHAARLARPFNKHLAHVGAFWKRAAQLTSATDPELSQACVDMATFLREESRLDELDVPAAIAKEQALATRLAGAGIEGAEMEGIVGYIQESSQAVLDGKDPTTVVKPVQKAAAGQ